MIFNAVNMGLTLLEGNDDGNSLPNMHEIPSLSVRRRQLWKVSLYTITGRVVYS